VLQCVAVCCSVLQRVAACCSVLHFVHDEAAAKNRREVCVCVCVCVSCVCAEAQGGSSVLKVPHVWGGVATISRLLKIIGLFCRI